LTKGTFTKKMAALLRVLRAAGPDRVLHTMTNVCAPKYDNQGWNNCFFTQLVGGRPELSRLQYKHGRLGGKAEESAALSRELGVKQDDVWHVIDLFDDKATVGPMLRYVRKWLRDRLRRAGRPNPLTGAPAIA
jgi:hypothetical protein